MGYLKKSIYFVLSVLFTVSLASCDSDDDDEWDARRDLVGWGYFDGTVNGDSVYLYNSATTVRFISQVRYPTYSNIESCRIDIDVPDKKASFSCRILYPCLGSLEIVNQHPENPYINDFNSFEGSTGNWILFEPKEDRPAKVDITNIEYKQIEVDGIVYKSIHIIEGDVDAVLYRGEDSISIKGHFATK